MNTFIVTKDDLGFMLLVGPFDGRLKADTYAKAHRIDCTITHAEDPVSGLAHIVEGY